MLMTDVELMLRNAMNKKGINQTDLSEATGMSKQFISMYLNGKKKHFISKSLITIADALGYDVDVRLVEKKEKFIMTREFIESARSIYGNVRKLSNDDGAKCVAVLDVMQDIEVEALLGMDGLTEVEERYIRERCDNSAALRGEEPPKDAYDLIGKSNLADAKPYVEGVDAIYDGEGIPDDVIISDEPLKDTDDTEVVKVKDKKSDKSKK